MITHPAVMAVQRARVHERFDQRANAQTATHMINHRWRQLLERHETAQTPEHQQQQRHRQHRRTATSNPEHERLIARLQRPHLAQLPQRGLTFQPRYAVRSIEATKPHASQPRTARRPGQPTLKS